MSTPELAQVKHLLYEQGNCLFALEKELADEKEVAQLEVNNQDMVAGIVHLIKNHFGPSEKVLQGVTITLLPLLFGCHSEFRCEGTIPSDGSLGRAFAGGAKSGSSSSSSSIPSLLSNSPVSRRSEWSAIPEEGESERASLLPFEVVNEAQVEEGSGGRRNSSISSGGTGSRWFSPERCSLSYKGSGV